MTVLDTARLRAARERAGLSQTEVSTRLQMAKGACNEWERGAKMPSLERFAALCRLLEVSADHLLGLEAVPGAASVTTRTDAAPRHYPVDSPDAVLADHGFPEGLRALADSRSLQGALRITPAEWSALASLEVDGGLTREGYLAMLVLLRATVAHSPEAQPDPNPLRRRGKQAGLQEPYTVHEPDRPDFQPD